MEFDTTQDRLRSLYSRAPQYYSIETPAKMENGYGAYRIDVNPYSHEIIIYERSLSPEGKNEVVDINYHLSYEDLSLSEINMDDKSIALLDRMGFELDEIVWYIIQAYRNIDYDEAVDLEQQNKPTGIPITDAELSEVFPQL